MAQVKRKAKLGQQQQFIADDRRSPAARAVGRFHGGQHGFQRIEEGGIGLALGQCRGGERRQPVDRGGGQPLGEQGRAAVNQLDRKLGKVLRHTEIGRASCRGRGGKYV